jgi:hypothetical protein
MRAAARAIGRLLATSGRRAGLATGRVLEPVRRRPSLVVVIALLVASAGPVAADRAPPAPAVAGRDLAFDRAATAELPERAMLRPPLRERPRPPGEPLTRDPPPWPAFGRDAPDHLLARALEEIHRRDPDRYRAMRRQAPRWGISRCDRALCEPDVQGQTLVTADGECLSLIDPEATLRVARRYRLPSLLWVADVLVHEHGHCTNVRNEYTSIQAQRRFLDAWPAGPGRERAKLYVGRLHLRLDATGNWRGR